MGVVKKFCAIFFSLTIVFSTIPSMLSVSASESNAPANKIDLSGYNPPSSYKKSVYYERLSSLSLSGDIQEDLVRVARTQVGYHEGSNNYTEYGREYGAQCAWCSMFVSWCGKRLKENMVSVPYYSFCQDGLNWYKRKGAFHPYRKKVDDKWEYYAPRKGDVVFFSAASDGSNRSHSHIGIVSQDCAAKSRIYTIEGNTSNRVRDDATRSLKNAETGLLYYPSGYYIVGYGRPSECSSSLGELSLSVSGKSGSKATLKYNAARATKYKIEYKKLNDKKYKTLKTTTSKTTVSPKLEKSTTYRFRVTAYKGSKTKTKTVKYRLMGKVTKVKCELKNKDNKVNGKITWKSQKYAAKYRVYKLKGKHYKLCKTVTKTEYNVNNLKGGKTYKYRIKAVNGSDVGESSETLSVFVIAAPKISVKAKDNNNAIIEISKVEKAKKYVIYTRYSSEDDYKKVGSTKAQEYALKVKTGKKAYIRVKASDGNILSTFSKTKAFLSLDKGKISYEWKSNTKIKLEWGKVSGASRYMLYRKGPGDKAFRVYRILSDNKATDSSLKPGKTYRYKVRASRFGSSGQIYGPYSSVLLVEPLSAPKITSLSQSDDNKFTIKWSKIKDAQKYTLYLSYDNKTYKKKKEFDKKTLSFTDKFYDSDKTHYFKLTASKKVNNKWITSPKSAAANVAKLGSITSFTATKDNKKIVLKWNAVKGAQKYKLYRSVNGNKTLYKTLTALTFTETVSSGAVKCSNFYSYYLVAASGKFVSGKSSVIEYMPIQQGKITSAEFSSMTVAKIVWNKVSSIDGYELYTCKGAGSWKKLYTGTNTSYTYKGLDYDDAAYKFKVRCYKKYNNKTYYGDYSTIVIADISNAISIPGCSLTLLSGDAEINILINSATDDYSYDYEIAYTTDTNSSYHTKQTSSQESQFTNLKNETKYYFKVRLIAELEDKTYYGDWSSWYSCTPHAHYTYSVFEDVVDLGAMFNEEPLSKPSIGYGSSSYMYVYSSLKNKNSNFFGKYKDALKESGATIKSSNATSFTFVMEDNNYKVEIIDNCVYVTKL